MTILSIIDQVAAEPSTNRKKQILMDNANNTTLRHVFYLAYSPIMFHVKKIPEYQTSPDPTTSLDDALQSLSKLYKRELTGHAGIEHLRSILSNVTKNDAIVISRIIQRDLRCGASDSIANKVWKGLIPEFPYMRCSLPGAVKLNKWQLSRGVLSQLKADGTFANLNYDINSNVELLSRTGSEYPPEPLQPIIDEVISSFIIDTQTHGELVVKRHGTILPREIGNGILNSVLKGGKFQSGDTPLYLVWDQIPLKLVAPKCKISHPYSQRMAALKLQTRHTKYINFIETEYCYTVDEIIDHFQKQLLLGLEGTVIKNCDGIWEDTTSKNQVKLKLNAEVDLEIVGFNPGNGKNESTFGSIRCRSSDDLLVVNVSGFTDTMRTSIHKNREALVGTIMTVKGNSIMPPSGAKTTHSIFLPRFGELRPDKRTADSLPEIKAQFANAINVIRSQF